MQTAPQCAQIQQDACANHEALVFLSSHLDFLDACISFSCKRLSVELGLAEQPWSQEGVAYHICFGRAGAQHGSV